VGWIGAADDLRIRRFGLVLELLLLVGPILALLVLEALYAHFPQRGFQQ
jgi:hypothetical protein